MPRTASPAVSVIVPLIARAELLERAGSQLRAQTLSDIEIVLVGGEAGSDAIGSMRADERVRREAPGLGLCDALNAGLEACRGERVMIFDPRDELEPRAIEALAVRMRHGGESGAFGGFRFRAPIGNLPHDPLADAPNEISFDELVTQQWFPLSAMMVDASAIGGIHFRASHAQGGCIHPADYEWLLRLAEVGVKWSRSRMDVARVWVRGLENNGCIEQRLRARARLIRERLIANGREAPDVRVLTQGAVDACMGLLADAENPPTLYCDASSRSTAEMARWWQRLGFVGAAPEHLNSFAEAKENESTAASAKRVLATLDPCRAVVIVGTGPAAPLLAGSLASAGMTPRICGVKRDLPGWVNDARAIVLNSGQEAPIRSQFVLTEPDVRVHLPAGASLVSMDEPGIEDELIRPTLGDDGEMPPAPVPRGLFALPLLIRTFIHEQIDLLKPVALLGLGRNARLLARDLSRAGIGVYGVDAGVQGSPWWAEVDGIASLTMCELEALPRDAQCIMTVLKDDGFAARTLSTRPGTRVLRWSWVSDVLAGVRPTAWDSGCQEAASTREAA
ncbi:MAG: glycosyltransferase family 2 protein [Phycisphaeraceae bacterium]|nr:glycosyltransferase family 2 protein [Phycisphaeraceae bacterium]